MTADELVATTAARLVCPTVPAMLAPWHIARSGRAILRTMLAGFEYRDTGRADDLSTAARMLARLICRLENPPAGTDNGDAGGAA